MAGELRRIGIRLLPQQDNGSSPRLQIPRVGTNLSTTLVVVETGLSSIAPLFECTLQVRLTESVLGCLQIVACGVLLIIMAVGNFLNTVATLATKAKIKNKMNRKRKEVSETIARTFSGPPKKTL